MKIARLQFIVCVLGAGLLNAYADTNTWGTILYTRYQSSKVYHTPLTAAAVRGTLAANETVKADFKQGNWYAVFRPSEAVRSITNAVGYMEEEDLFPEPLPPGPIAGGVGDSPAVSLSIEKIRSIPPASKHTSYVRSTSSQQQSPAVSQPQRAPAETYVPTSAISWREIDEIYSLKSEQTDLRKDELWKQYKGKKIEWTGNVTAVADSWGSLTMQIKMNADTWTSDLIITLKKTEKDKAIRFKEGDTVTFRGVLNRWGTVMPISLNEGEIVSSYSAPQTATTQKPEGSFSQQFKAEMSKTMEDINSTAEEEMRRIERSVAEDAVKQYEIAKRSGSAMDAYVHAGFVAAAYLQAKDEANYKKWKEIERKEGIRAGMPQ